MTEADHYLRGRRDERRAVTDWLYYLAQEIYPLRLCDGDCPQSAISAVMDAIARGDHWSVPCPHPECYDRGECCGGDCFAQVGRNPEGEDPQGLRAEHEHAVGDSRCAHTSSPTPSPKGEQS